MNKRTLSIIYELCGADSEISIGSLAEKHQDHSGRSGMI